LKASIEEKKTIEKEVKDKVEKQCREIYEKEKIQKDLENKKMIEENLKLIEKLKIQVQEQKREIQSLEEWKAGGWFKAFDEELKILPSDRFSSWGKNLKEAKRLLNVAKKDNLLCKVCCDETAVVIFLPCKHMVVCQNCSNVPNCIICRQQIVDKLVPFT